MQLIVKKVNFKKIDKIRFQNIVILVLKLNTIL